ncbi:MAG: TadG family pilus assembly protein [Sideroxydans sp.]
MFSRQARQRQTGVISVLAAVTLGAAIIVAALAVDLGHIFWAKRDLQKAADLASLSALTDLSQASAIAQQIAKKNNFDYQNAANSLTVTTGIYDWPNRAFAPGGAAASLNSVEVKTETTVPYFFLPGSKRVTATAIAASDAVAGFSLGSFIARLDTTDSALLNGVVGGLLGGSVSLDIGSYKGLAAANVTLAGLQAALGLSSVGDVLNANLTLASLLDASITALNNNGDAASLNAAGILGSLRAAVSPSLSLRVGDLIRVDADNPQSAANAEVNLLQMILLGAELGNANGSNFISRPLAVSIPGVASIDLALSLNGKPSIAIGPARRDSNGAWMTQAYAAPVRLRLNMTLLGTVGGGVVNLPIYIEGGAANAALTGIQCRSPKNSSAVTIQTQPGLLAAYIGEVSDAAMQNYSVPVTVSEATLVNVLGLVRVTGSAYVPLQGASQELVFNGPFDSNNTQTATSGLGIGGLLNSNLVLTPHVLGLGLGVGAILNSLTSLLGGVLGPVLDGLLNPLLSMLGLQLGGADLTAFYLSCGVPQLVH